MNCCMYLSWDSTSCHNQLFNFCLYHLTADFGVLISFSGQIAITIDRLSEFSKVKCVTRPDKSFTTLKIVYYFTFKEFNSHEKNLQYS